MPTPTATATCRALQSLWLSLHSHQRLQLIQDGKAATLVSDQVLCHLCKSIHLPWTPFLGSLPASPFPRGVGPSDAPLRSLTRTLFSHWALMRVCLLRFLYTPALLCNVLTIHQPLFTLSGTFWPALRWPWWSVWGCFVFCMLQLRPLC